MRKQVAAFCILAAMALPAWAAKRISVAQLQQIMEAAGAVHHPDAVVAQQLADAALTERLSPSTLQTLVANSPGPKTTEALRVLADESAFLDLPAAELPSRPNPDFAAQKAIINQVVRYVARTLPTLPNFMATRVTEHFADPPSSAQQGSEQPLAGLYLLGSMRTPIAFHDGRESDDPILLAAAEKGADRASKEAAKAAKSAQTARSGLVSWGEFGPILGLVLVDAAKGKLGWGRWELWNDKSAAVFQFSVDRSISHYTLQYWRGSNGEVVNSSYGSREGSRGSAAGVSKGMVKDSGDSGLLRQATGYHGTLTADPETGAILKIELEADLRDDAIQRAAMVVEYGPVKIGDSIYTCPMHSIAISTSMERYQSTPISPIVMVKEQQLNDVVFTGYRRFGSESTLILDAGSGESGGQPAGATGSASAVASLAPDAAPPSAAISPTAEAPAPKPAPARISAEEQEMLVTAANGLSGMEGDADQSSPANSSSFTLKVTTRLVDLGLFATDKHSKPILDLKKDEIEIYDNGRKQQLVSFQHATPAAPQLAQPLQPSQPSGTFTNAATVIHEVQDAPDLLILLIDESHLPFNDLNRARGEMLRFLKATRPTSRLALYSIGEHGFRVIQDVTVDHPLVEAKLTAWMPTAAGISQAAELDRRNRQQFDTVHNPSDLNYVNGNHNDAPDAITSADPELRQLGDNPLGAALNAMVALARHFAAVPGHKSLAWISGDSVLANWDDQTVSMERTVKDVDAAVNHTKEALNEAHISLYAVDASMESVGGAAVDASLANPNVQLSATSTANSAPGASGTARLNQTGRMNAQMQQDTRGIQGPVRELAESTGGRAINKGSDLKATLDGIEADSASLYEIGFDPDTPADGKFHSLTVKIPSRKDVKLRYRTGYLYSEEAQSTQQRFQQAVWSPQDSTGIQLTAEAVPAADSASGSSTIKLRIAFPGLALQKEAERWTDNLYIFVAQRDDAAQKAEVSGDTLRLSLKQATYDSGMPAGIPYQREVDVKSKLGSVRVIVVDGNSGKMGSVTVPASAFRP